MIKIFFEYYKNFVVCIVCRALPLGFVLLLNWK